MVPQTRQKRRRVVRQTGRPDFSACRLSDAGEPLDAVTISHAAGVENAFALELMETTPTAANVLVYAGLVRKNGIWAALDELGHHLQENALSRLENPLEAISQAQSRLSEYERITQSLET